MLIIIILIIFFFKLKQDYLVTKRFGDLVDPLREENEDPTDYENRVEKIFKDLVAYIAKKYYNIANIEQRDPIVLPETIQEFNIFYKLKLPGKIVRSPSVSKEVREVTDIHIATINSVIHSSMCCGKERRSWAYQLFKVMSVDLNFPIQENLKYIVINPTLTYWAITA